MHNLHFLQHLVMDETVPDQKGCFPTIHSLNIKNFRTNIFRYATPLNSHIIGKYMTDKIWAPTPPQGMKTTHTAFEDFTRRTEGHVHIQFFLLPWYVRQTNKAAEELQDCKTNIKDMRQHLGHKNMTLKSSNIRARTLSVLTV